MDQGMLQEEQRIAELLPPETLRGITNGESATVGQLLNHSSGIATWEFDSRWITKGRGYAQNPDHLWTPIEPLEFIRGDGHPATNAAGQGYAYSNTNFTLLGLIIERVTGRPLVELLHEQIFNPLGLMDIRMEGFEPIDPKRVPPRYHYNTPEFRDTAGISPYYRNLGTLLDVSRSNLSTEWAAGGLMATPRDLAAFTLALRDGRVVPRTTLARMLRFRPTDAPDEEVGAGIFREQLADGWLDGYDGGVLGFGAVMGWVEGDDIVLALSTNVGMMHAGDKSFYPLQLVRSASFMAALRKFAHALTPSGG
jgi:D-alanyl-D-alanine carboxypeptidase